MFAGEKVTEMASRRNLPETSRTNGASFGIGPSGLRERLRELGGHLDIQSNSTDAQIVTVPLGEETRQRPAEFTSRL
jgi:signal transduction histidine kinase